MLNPPAWDTAIYAQRHYVENTFSRLKDTARIALRRDRTRRSWMGFAYLAAAMINLRLSQFSHTAYHCCVKNYMKSNVINGLEETATCEKI